MRNYDEELAGSGLPELLEKHVEGAVTKRLRDAANEALISPFREEVKRQAQKILAFWPKDELGLRTIQKEKILQQLHLENPFVALKGKWSLECRRCDYPHTLTLDSVHDIKGLLTYGNVKVPASSISAYVSGGPHSLSADLKEIVKQYIQKALQFSRTVAVTYREE